MPPSLRSSGRSLRGRALNGRALHWAGLGAAFLAASCAGAGGASGGAADVASESEWRALREPRLEPLPGAPRVTVSDVSLVGRVPWPGEAPVDAELGISELVTTNLLRRRDVDFVERRRFSAAAAAERRGTPSPAGRPPVGVSRSAELAIGATWIPTTEDQAAVELRLIEVQTGNVVGTGRSVVPRSADVVDLARAMARGALGLLDQQIQLPHWDDPLAPGDETANVPATSGVSTEATRHFLRGLAAEEAWSWERARRGYQDALAVEPDFYEARVALARTARLRLGGTLAES